MGSAAGETFQAHRTGAGEAIQDGLIDENVLQGIEERLLGAVGDGAGGIAGRR
jgi:hypothetical protein